MELFPTYENFKALLVTIFPKWLLLGMGKW